MHNHEGNGGWMMWVMMICCMAPLLVVVFGVNSLRSSWPVFVVIGLMLAAHWVLMRKAHKRPVDEKPNENTIEEKSRWRKYMGSVQ